METQNSATAAVNPPTTVGVATVSPTEALLSLNKSLLFSNVTIPALQAAGIPVPSMATIPQHSADLSAPKTAAGVSREGASAGPSHLEGDSPSRNIPGGDPDGGGSSDDDGNGRRKKSKPSRKDREPHRRKERTGESPTGDSSPSSSSSSDSGSNSESDSLTAPTPTFGPKQKRLSVWKPTNHRFRGVCNHRTYRLIDTDPTVDDRVFATTRKRAQYLLVVIGEYKVSGVDPIRVISFLAR